MARIDYNGRVAAAYEKGRGAPAGGLDGWRRALANHLPVRSPLLDLGAGTGVYTRLMRSWFDLDVLAVEPAYSMLAQVPTDTRVRRVVGRAERIPIGDARCGAAWLSTMIHHIEDLHAAARELRRVLTRQAPVLIRSAFPGDQERIALYRYFPTAGSVLDTFPTIGNVRDAFGAAGFRLQEQRRISQVNAATLTEFYEKARHRANTTLLAISDEDYATGLEQLRRAAATTDAPATSELTLLVLR